MSEQKNIGFNKGLVMSPSAGEDGEATVLHNLVVRRGELVNNERPKKVDGSPSIEGTLKLIHKVKNRDGVQENYVSYEQRLDDLEEEIVGYMLQYNHGRVVSRIHLFAEDVVKSVCAIGNTLAITADDGVYYAVWKMKEDPVTHANEMGYVWLGKDFPDVELRFGLSGEWTQLVERDALTSSEVDDSNDDDSSEQSFNVVKATSASLQLASNTLSTFTFNSATTVSLHPSYTYKLELTEATQKSCTIYLFAKEVQGQDETEIYRKIIKVGDDAGTAIFTTPKADNDINIRFEAWQVFTSSVTVTLRIYEGFESLFTLSFDNDNDTAFNRVMGCANTFINTATKDNKFVYPFFVRYALKLYDGTFVKPSNLTLMTPSIGVAPVVWMPAINGDQPHYDIFTEGYMAELLVNKLSGSLSDWKDIVSGVSIAVSSPIYSYKQGETWDIHKKKIFIHDKTDTNQLSVDGSCLGLVTNMSGGHRQEYSFSECMANSLATANFRQIILPSHNEVEQRKDLTSKNVMYVVKDFTLDEFDALGNVPTSLNLDEGTLSALEGRETMADNYTSLSTRTGKNVSVYNSRLVLSNIEQQVFSGFAPDSHNQEMDYTWEGNKPYPCLAVVTIVENGEEKKVARLMGEENHSLLRWLYYPSTNAKRMRVYMCKEYANSSNNPITTDYVFYKLDFDLTRHELINGAYWFDNFRGVDVDNKGIALGYFGFSNNTWEWDWYKDSDNKIIATKEERDYLGVLVEGADNNETSVTLQYSEEPAVFHYPNRVVQSELYNPFVFPAVLQSEVGSGEIVGMASTTDALSQGQLGQFPMYLFTSEGVWAMNVGSDGSFSGKQPLSRDVCINPQSILQLDKAVSFCTDKGMMLLSGNSIKLISGVLNGRDKVGAVSFIYDDGNDRIGEVLAAMNACHFTKAVREKRDDGTFYSMFLYDYQHQLIRVFYKDESADDRSVQWVYDIENDVWSTADWLEVKSIVAGYPHAYVQVGEDVMQYRENKTTAVQKGYVLTRPISFGNPLAMKHINDFRLLYWNEENLSRCAEVQPLLSNDRQNWFRAGSLRQHSAKWWRFAVLIRQNDWDALSGLCVEYELTRTNKMR